MSTTSATLSATRANAGSSAADVTDPLVPSIGSHTLSQDDFLKLLVAQMSAQDPMNPQTDTQMAAQMAQFTSLQQSGTMSKNIATMLTQQQLLQANGMLGSTVSLQADAKTLATGVVQSVQITDGIPQLVVNNKSYDLSQVLSIAPTSVSPTPAAPTSFLPSIISSLPVASQTTP